MRTWIRTSYTIAAFAAIAFAAVPAVAAESCPPPTDSCLAGTWQLDRQGIEDLFRSIGQAAGRSALPGNATMQIDPTTSTFSIGRDGTFRGDGKVAFTVTVVEGKMTIRYHMELMRGGRGRMCALGSDTIRMEWGEVSEDWGGSWMEVQEGKNPPMRRNLPVGTKIRDSDPFTFHCSDEELVFAPAVATPQPIRMRFRRM